VPWKVEYLDDLDIVQLTISGDFSDQDVKAAAPARIAMGRDKGTTRFIIDAVEMELTGSTFAIYDVPANVYVEEGMERTARIAVLTANSSSSKEIVQFYENASVNRGWNVSAFMDREEAIAWLQG
jgi:chorismate mutase